MTRPKIAGSSLIFLQHCRPIAIGDSMFLKDRKGDSPPGRCLVGRSVGRGPSDRCLSRSGSGSFSTALSFSSPSPSSLPRSSSLSFLNGFSVLARRRRRQRDSVRRVANTTIVSCGGRALLAGWLSAWVRTSFARPRPSPSHMWREREDRGEERKDFTLYNLVFFFARKSK